MVYANPGLQFKPLAVELEFEFVPFLCSIVYFYTSTCVRFFLYCGSHQNKIYFTVLGCKAIIFAYSYLNYCLLTCISTTKAIISSFAPSNYCSTLEKHPRKAINQDEDLNIYCQSNKLLFVTYYLLLARMYFLCRNDKNNTFHNIAYFIFYCEISRFARYLHNQVSQNKAAKMAALF